MPVNNEHNLGAKGFVQPDGTFRMGTYKEDDGAIEGEHLVIVVPSNKDPKDDTGGPPRGIVDVHFRNFNTSGLRVNVTKDASANDFTLKVERPQQ